MASAGDPEGLQLGGDSRWLDPWIARPAVRTFHWRSARVSADSLWSSAQAVRVSDTSALGRLVRWRIPGVPSWISYREMLRQPPFRLLEEGNRHSLSGLCGRIWTIKRDYAELSDAADFVSHSEPGTVRVLFAHWVRPVDARSAVLVSETRVEPVDRGAALRLRALWAVLGIFEPLIASEPLALAARNAEAMGAPPQP